MSTTERDAYVWDLECPCCKRTGVARTSESAFPFISGLLFRVDEIASGFRVSKLGSLASTTEIVCAGCNVVV